MTLPLAPENFIGRGPLCKQAAGCVPPALEITRDCDLPPTHSSPVAADPAASKSSNCALGPDDALSQIGLIDPEGVGVVIGGDDEGADLVAGHTQLCQIGQSEAAMTANLEDALDVAHTQAGHS